MIAGITKKTVITVAALVLAFSPFSAAAAEEESAGLTAMEAEAVVYDEPADAAALTWELPGILEEIGTGVRRAVIQCLKVFHGATKRAAHQKNSAERVAEARSFDAIEVDVRETDENGDIHLYHDYDHGYTLQMFLDDCRANGQTAILDMKSGCSFEDVVGCVKEKDMLSDTFFQVGKPDYAREIRGYDPAAQCWLLNGVGDEGYLRLDTLQENADCLAGVNVCGTVVDQGSAMACIEAVHAIRGTDGPMDICIFAYGDINNVYGGDAVYEECGADLLMTDRYPGE